MLTYTNTIDTKTVPISGIPVSYKRNYGFQMPDTVRHGHRRRITHMADIIDEEALKFGQRLQEYREKAKITQQEMAEATGLTKNYISSIERGIHKCNAQTFIIYAKKTGVSLDEIAGLTPKAKLNIQLLQKISEMSDSEQQRALQILELMR